MSLEIRPAYDDLENIKILFNEYTQYLFTIESNFQNYLDLQNYDDEITNLHEKYRLPSGRLYIAYYAGQAAGCIALRQINQTDCEMKRLYVRPQFRGKGIAKTLSEIIIRDARSIGYQSMLLDTLPTLVVAISLYEKMGFYRTLPYNASPVTNTVFMKLDLYVKSAESVRLTKSSDLSDLPSIRTGITHHESAPFVEPGWLGSRSAEKINGHDRRQKI